MLLRKIRLSGLIIGGAVLALVSLAWIYFFDVSVKTEVKWLYVGLCFGVMSGVLTIFGGYLSNDEEKINSLIVLSIALVFDILFTVFLFVAHSDQSVISSATQMGSKELFIVINIIAIIVSIAAIIGLCAGIALDAYAKYLSRQEDKIFQEKIK